MVLGKGKGKLLFFYFLVCLFLFLFLCVCVLFSLFVLFCLFVFFFGGGEGVKGVVFIFSLEALVCFFELTWKGKVTTMPATNKAVAIFRDGAVLSPYFFSLTERASEQQLGSVF